LLRPCRSATNSVVFDFDADPAGFNPLKQAQGKASAPALQGAESVQNGILN
jgi:hypothetical protein